MTPQVADILLAAFVPLVVGVLKQKGFGSSLNAFIAILVYVLFGIAAVATQNEPFDINNIVPSVGTFVTVGRAAYYAFWKNVGEPKLVAATSIVK